MLTISSLIFFMRVSGLVWDLTLSKFMTLKAQGTFLSSSNPRYTSPKAPFPNFDDLSKDSPLAIVLMFSFCISIIQSSSFSIIKMAQHTPSLAFDFCNSDITRSATSLTSFTSAPSSPTDDSTSYSPTRPGCLPSSSKGMSIAIFIGFLFSSPFLPPFAYSSFLFWPYLPMF